MEIFLTSIMARNIAVILLFCFLLEHGELLEIKPLDGNSGLYFEETGGIYFYTDEWKFVVNLNLTKYRIELNRNKNSVKLITNSCEKLIEMAKNSSNKSNEGCGPFLYQLNSLMNNIEDNDRNWFVKDKRFRRSAVSKLIFDDWSEDKALFKEQFEKMSFQMSENVTETVKRTSFISSTLNSIARPFEQNQLSIDDYVTNQLSFVSNTILTAENGSCDYAIMRLQLRTTIQELISCQMHILTTFALKQKQYLNIMSLEGQKYPILPDILQSDIFIDELNRVENIISENGLHLPLQAKRENLFSFYHNSIPEIQTLNDQIYVSFRIPLISKHARNNFSLLKVTSSIYRIRENLYSFIIPNHEFIALDVHKEHYVPLTTQDLQNCYQFNNSTSIICKQLAPIMSTYTSNECEINLLQQNLVKSTCNIRFIRNNADIFVKLLKPNSWLLTLSKSKKVRYICEGQPTEEHSIEAGGLLTIESDCKLATDNVMITGHNSFPKSKIYEHPYVKVDSHTGDIIETFLTDRTHVPIRVNDVPQVVNFGENEKLLRISFSADDIKINSLHERHSDLINDHISLSRTSALLLGIEMLAAFLMLIHIYVRLTKLESSVTDKKKKSSESAKPLPTSLAKPLPTPLAQPSAPTLEVVVNSK